ncbi:tyrosine decarboxylase [Clostridium tarantellae]|uniref:Tyrosine decarboxylase n=1 Tax=Clostridium tarantellae TaxID=39493 RepID=A0A6I1MRG4_9CLOT|nr:tyrosine decarboxylase [Clostridium tarantellae]MPQ42879.1 tyrosine decarboxylase [Clostridium tarantellae]
MNTDTNLNALFLGAKSENADLFKRNLLQLFDDHAQWRKNYHPEDADIINSSDMEKTDFKFTKNKMEDVMKELSSKLRAGSIPWHSPRYLGHMNSETLMPALLGYFAATLYNGNNVAYESSPATSKMEEEVGHDFCKLMGYDADTSWGHICCDGSVANIEGLWYARNLKSLPLAMKEVCPELVEGKTEWELLNMPINEILNLMEKNPSKLDELKNHSARGMSNKIGKLGKWLVPRTKHYSWLKAADIIGIGTENIISIDVQDNYRMSIENLKKTIEDLSSKNIPILGVVAVVGTTEEGAIDYVDKVVELKKDFAEKGINFYFHVDSAYGGYARSIFLDEEYKFIPKEELHTKYLQHKVFKNPDFNWPSDDIYNAFKAINEADSITIDPHKMGYVPYSAGGIAIKDKRMRDSISYFATYVFEKSMEIPALLGAFMLEGSKAGATAASVWAAHKTMPLNITGYGQLIGASIEGAYNLYVKLKEQKQYKIGDTIVDIHDLVKPDFNMVDFVFNIHGNKDLAKMNELNHLIYDESSFVEGNVYANDFITSHTEFAVSDYSNSPLDFVERCGIPKEQWKKIDSVTLLRACVLSPFLNNQIIFNQYAEKFDKAIEEKLEKILNSHCNLK